MILLFLQNKLGDTALHACAWKGHAPCVSLLLEKGMCMCSLFVKSFKRTYPMPTGKKFIGIYIPLCHGWQIG